MPMYDYCCDSCGVFEVFQSMKDDHFTTCPKCNGEKIERYVSGGSGVHYKVGGFYNTDYRKTDANIKKYMPNE